jgi:hypothetical protein
LHKTAFFGPFQHPPEILLQDRISLRVSQHAVGIEPDCLPMMGARRVPEMAGISSQS